MDDEARERRRIEEHLVKKGYEVLAVGSVNEAIDALRRARFDAFLTDCNIPGVDASRTSDAARKINPDMAVIIMTSFGTIETAVKAIKAGAYDYLPKPIDLDQLAVVIERISERQDLIRENAELKELLIERYQFAEIVSTSHAMEEVLEPGGPGGGKHCHGTASGRKRHGQGAGRQGHSLQQSPRRLSARQSKLCCSAREPARERAVRA